MFAFNLRVAVNMAIWRYGYMALWRYALGIQYSWMGTQSHMLVCRLCMHACMLLGIFLKTYFKNV